MERKKPAAHPVHGRFRGVARSCNAAPRTTRNRRGQTTSICRDLEEKPFTIDAGGAEIIDLDYDTWNRLEYVTQSGGELPGPHTFTHDLLGRLTSLDGPWTGDSDKLTGNYTGTDPRPGSISHSGGFDTESTYDTLASGGHLATLTSKLPGGATIAKHNYTRDTLGQIATWKREAPHATPGTTHQYQWTLAHDFSVQLTSVIETDLTGSLRASRAFAYDASNNRTSAFSAQAAATARAMTAAHNSMNQLTTLGGGGKTRVVEPRRCWTAPAEGAFGDRRRRFLGWMIHTQSGVPRQVGVPAAVQHHGNTSAGAKWCQITSASGKTTTFHYNALGERTKMVHVEGGTTRTECVVEPRRCWTAPAEGAFGDRRRRFWGG